MPAKKCPHFHSEPNLSPPGPYKKEQLLSVFLVGTRNSKKRLSWGGDLGSLLGEGCRESLRLALWS